MVVGNRVVTWRYHDVDDLIPAARIPGAQFGRVEGAAREGTSQPQRGQNSFGEI
jgi:hypothetical protein